MDDNLYLMARTQHLAAIHSLCLLLVLIAHRRLRNRSHVNLPTRDMILHRQQVRDEMLQDLFTSGKCRQLIRMSESAFRILCQKLESYGGLRATQRMTIEELDQLLEANEVCFENIDSGESPHATSASTHTQVKIPNATKIKSRKRKLEEDDAFTSKIMSAMKNLSDAIDRSTKVMESSRPHVYSENEIYQELEHMGLEPLDIPDAYLFLVERPDNEEMKRFVKKIVDLMRDESFFSWQGGPIIMLQIENEYGNWNVQGSFGQPGRNYIKWAADMAVGLGAGVPWVMCRQTDAPEYIIDGCNGFYCDGFKPNSNKNPVLWTENWDGWYTNWGGRLPHRPVEDLAFAVARFYQRGGSFQNYYMFFGGTNFGRTSGGPNYITSYDFDAPIDEYGLLSQPKWGHLKDLHAAIKLCEPALVAADSAEYIKLGSSQEAYVYRGGNTSICSAFLANIDEHQSSTVQFLGRSYTLPPWSVSILPDCKNTVLNTAKIGAQTSIKVVDLESTSSTKTSARELFMVQKEDPLVSGSWMTLKEPIGVWGDNFTVQGIWEHLNVTKDRSDYLWYITRVNVSDEDIKHWKENAVSPLLRIDRMRDMVRIFINGQLIGSAEGDWVEVVQQVQLKQGYNDLMLLSQTMGLQNYGAFLEKDGAGFKGQITLKNFKNGDVDLTHSQWTYQVGLKGEFMKYFATDDNESSKWTNLKQQEVPSILSWYKTQFDSPGGKDPVVIDMSSMGKGEAWVNGHHIGRYWTLVAPKDGCQENCDYRGVYDFNKCNTNCGKPTQTRYHVPRSWLQPKDNLLVLFEETGGNPFKISVKTVSIETVCAHVSEDYYPPVQTWSRSNGELITSQKNPIMQLQCEDGYTIASIDFASYGTPQGSCQTYSTGKCHASTSTSILSKACEGQNSCKIEVSNSVFGDPCRWTVKTLAVKARCKPSPTSTLWHTGLSEYDAKKQEILEA